MFEPILKIDSIKTYRTIKPINSRDCFNAILRMFAETTLILNSAENIKIGAITAIVLLKDSKASEANVNERNSSKAENKMVSFIKGLL